MQAILETEDVDSLESLRVKYLGKKGELTGILRQMGRLSASCTGDGSLCLLPQTKSG